MAFFAQLEDMRQRLFIAEGAELPAIGDDLALQAAANTPASFDMPEPVRRDLRDRRVDRGCVAESRGRARPCGWRSEVASTIPAASPTATSDSLQTTYAGLVDKFAKMVTEIDKSIVVQSQQVRGDQGLLELVGELRGRGTWTLDTIGIRALPTRPSPPGSTRTLMPTVYDRYVITDCWVSSPNYSYGSDDCTGPTGRAVIGDTHNFTAIAQRHHWDPDFANWWETRAVLRRGRGLFRPLQLDSAPR